MSIRDYMKIVEAYGGAYGRYVQRRAPVPVVKDVQVAMSRKQAELAEEALRHVSREIYDRDSPEAEALRDLAATIKKAISGV